MMKRFQILCLFVIVSSLLFLGIAAKGKPPKGKKSQVDEDDATVEEISEEDYKEQQRREARKPKPTASTPKPEAKQPEKPNPKEQAKPDTKEDSKPKDSKEKDGKTQESSKQETSKTDKTGKPEETGKPVETSKADKTGKPVETSKAKTGEETSQTEGVLDDEMRGEMEAEEEDDGEVEEDDEEEGGEEEEEHEAPSGIRDPRPCEVCKYLAVELQGRLTETGKSKEWIETGHGIMPGDRKKKSYQKSELRFIEALHEPHVCDKILDYDIHAERKKSLRYAKGQSETRKTLHWLRMKGVKVDMGMPEEMWTGDGPSSEITHLQRLCIDMVETNEEALEDWYWGHQEQHLYEYLCRDRALKDHDLECLQEEFVAPPPPKDEDEDDDEDDEDEEESDSDSTTKGDGGVPSSSMPPGGDPGTPATPTVSPTPTESPAASSQTATPKTEL